MTGLAAQATANPALRAPADFYKGGAGVALDPVSLAIQAGGFLLDLDAAKKRAKFDRLLASTERDMGVTGHVGNFIQSHFDPTDPETYRLLDMVQADLSITDPKDTQRGDRQHNIVESAIPIFARQLSDGRGFFPSGIDLSFPQGQSSDMIGGRLVSNITLSALNTISKSSLKKTVDDLIKDSGLAPKFQLEKSNEQLRYLGDKILGDQAARGSRPSAPSLDTGARLADSLPIREIRPPQTLYESRFPLEPVPAGVPRGAARSFPITGALAIVAGGLLIIFLIRGLK